MDIDESSDACAGMGPSPDQVTGADAGTDSDAAVTFFWRPGCGFCSRLETQLEELNLPLTKINIWNSAEAAAVVRELAGGNETVPTVVVGGLALVNPSIEDVKDVIAERVPHLLER